MYELDLSFLCKNQKYIKFLNNATNLYGGFWLDKKAVFTSKREFNDFVVFIWKTFDIEGNDEIITSKIFRISDGFVEFLYYFKILNIQNVNKKSKTDLDLFLAEINTLNEVEFLAFFIISNSLNLDYRVNAEIIKNKFKISEEQFQRFLSINSIAIQILGIRYPLKMQKFNPLN